ncbi:formin-binding protein 1 homolog isoform X3 [Parasteatoda tepidariorum]|uniref:formin-binding protein 1 homolog isoform X3 n=1 Tax=Parasteatoda tepidariorum TaxID=114398 RepID=UPI00077F9680|nr:formin-binding protein 1 homolog isoform X1 [Parasteatoda tepidariorum]
MSWGTELWDQYDHLASHSLKGIEFLEKYSQFVKDRCAIENEYANKLRKLTKNYHIKKKADDDLQFSTCRAFVLMMNEINDMAGQHELISENLNLRIVKEISSFSKELKDERKQHLQEGAKLQSNIQASLNQLEKSKKCYEKSFKESEKANENYQKALADLHLSRIELEKARLNSISKQQSAEDSKQDYSNQLQKSNEAQKQHYFELMPKVFQDLQDMEEKRILYFQTLMKNTTDVQRQVLPFISKCLDETDMAADSIDPKSDSNIVIGKLKSGYQPPGDIPFEELIPNTKIADATDSPPVLLGKSETLKGTISLQKMKKRGGLFSIFSAPKTITDELKDDYSDLPPNQRKKKLNQKIESISSQIAQETATKDGLLKMKAAYEQNNALGDPVSIEQQMPDIINRIEKLQAQLHKYQGFLADAEGKSVTPETHMKNGNNASETNLSRSTSNSSVNKVVKSVAPAIPLPRETASGANGNAVNESGESEYDNAGVTEFEAEPLPALGTARALYPFDAQSEGSIPMEEKEEFEVVELDQGDGWTRVRRSNMEEGFVPTSYIECFLYNSC